MFTVCDCFLESATYGYSDHYRTRDAEEGAAGRGKTRECAGCRGVSADAREKRHTPCWGGTHPRSSDWIRPTQEMAFLHFRARRLVASSGMLRLIPASSRQGRTSCLDETVISSEVSNFAREARARTYGYSATGIDRIHRRHDPR